MSKETLTRGEAQSVLSDLNKELDKLGNEIKNRKVFGGVVGVLEEKSSLIQSKLNELLKKGGLITEEDFNDSYNLIRAESKQELLDLKKKAGRNLRLYVGAFILIGIGVYLLLREK